MSLDYNFSNVIAGHNCAITIVNPDKTMTSPLASEDCARAGKQAEVWTSIGGGFTAASSADVLSFTVACGKGATNQYKIDNVVVAAV